MNPRTFFSFSCFVGKALSNPCCVEYSLKVHARYRNLFFIKGLKSVQLREKNRELFVIQPQAFIPFQKMLLHFIKEPDAIGKISFLDLHDVFYFLSLSLDDFMRYFLFTSGKRIHRHLVLNIEDSETVWGDMLSNHSFFFAQVLIFVHKFDDIKPHAAKLQNLSRGTLSCSRGYQLINPLHVVVLVLSSLECDFSEFHLDPTTKYWFLRAKYFEKPVSFEQRFNDVGLEFFNYQRGWGLIFNSIDFKS